MACAFTANNSKLTNHQIPIKKYLSHWDTGTNERVCACTKGKICVWTNIHFTVFLQCACWENLGCHSLYCIHCPNSVNQNSFVRKPDLFFQHSILAHSNNNPMFCINQAGDNIFSIYWMSFKTAFSACFLQCTEFSVCLCTKLKVYIQVYI